jgi:hypothetical protein
MQKDRDKIPMYEKYIAPRDRVHKSDGRQPLTNGRRFVILSAKRNLDDSLTVRTKISHVGQFDTIHSSIERDSLSLTRIG